MLEPPQRKLMRLLWEHGRLSRWELHERSGLTPNRVGAVSAELLRLRLVREETPERGGPGRPRVPLGIDPAQRRVLGLALSPGATELATLNLRGQLVGQPARRTVADPDRLVAEAAALLAEANRGESPIALGLSVTGFSDPDERSVLLSSALRRRGQRTSLEPIYQAAAGLPVVLENDMHALAARWLLTHRVDQQEDVLLVRLEDGQVGAGLLVEGRPNRGCVTSGNELGHTRFFVETDRCFCGQTGCLERIFSTAFLDRQEAEGSGPALSERAYRFGEHPDPVMERAIEYVACGLANTVNLLRPHRLVLVSTLARASAFTDRLLRRTRGEILVDLADRTRIELWDEPAAGSAETAGWLVMAELIYGGWGAGELPTPAATPADS